MSSKDAVRDEADEPPDTEAFARYKSDIAARLRGVCGDLTEAQFDALVDDVARMRLRLEVLEDLPDGLRPLRASDIDAARLPKTQEQA